MRSFRDVDGDLGRGGINAKGGGGELRGSLSHIQPKLNGAQYSTGIPSTRNAKDSLPSATPFEDMNFEKLLEEAAISKLGTSGKDGFRGPNSSSGAASQHQDIIMTNISDKLDMDTKIPLQNAGGSDFDLEGRRGNVKKRLPAGQMKFSESGWLTRINSTRSALHSLSAMNASEEVAGTNLKDPLNRTGREVLNAQSSNALETNTRQLQSRSRMAATTMGAITSTIQNVRSSYEVERTRPWRAQESNNIQDEFSATHHAAAASISRERQEELLGHLNSTLNKMLDGWRIARMKQAAKKREKLKESRKLIRKYQEKLLNEGKIKFDNMDANSLAAEILDPETVLQLALEPTPAERRQELLYQVIDQIEDGLGELKVWSAVMDEITSRPSLCPSKALSSILKRIGAAHAAQYDLVEHLLISVRKRLKTDWLHSKLIEKRDESTSGMRSRLSALQQELDAESRRSNELEARLLESSESISLLIDVDSAANALEDLRVSHASGTNYVQNELVSSALVSKAPYIPMEEWDTNTKTLRSIKPASKLAIFSKMLHDPTSKEGLDAAIELAEDGEIGDVVDDEEGMQTGEEESLSTFITQPDYSTTVLAKNKEDRIAKKKGIHVSSAEERYQSALSMLGTPPLSIMPLVSSSRISDSVRLDSRYFRFRFEPDDDGVLLKLTQAATSEPTLDYLELTIQVNEPPTTESFLHKFSTYNGEEAIIELKSHQLSPGDVFVRVLGRGTRSKTFGLELRIHTAVIDSTQPLKDILTDMTTQGQWQSLLVDKMSILDGLSHSAARGELATSTMRVDRGCLATSPPILDPELVITDTSSNERGAIDSIMSPEALSQNNNDNVDVGSVGFLGEFAPLFTYGSPNPKTLRTLPQKAIMRIILQFYDEKLVYDSENKHARRVPFAHFVYNYFKSRFGLVKLAEVHLCEIIESIRTKYPTALRAQMFARFCGVFSPVYSMKVFDTFMESYKTLKHRLSLTKRTAQIELENGSVLILFSAACEAMKDLFKSQPPTVIAGHLKRLEKKIARHNPRRVDLDETLDLYMELSRRDMCVSSSHLKALFQMGDVCGNGYLTPDQFVGIMRSFCPWFEDLEIYIILYEGLVLSNSQDSLKLSFNGFLMIGNDYPMSARPKLSQSFQVISDEPHLTLNDVPLPVSLEVQERLVKQRRAMERGIGQERDYYPDGIVTDGSNDSSTVVQKHDTEDDQPWDSIEWAKSSAEAFVQTWASLKPLFEDQLEYLTRSYCANVPNLEQMARDLDSFAQQELGEEMIPAWTLLRGCAKSINDAVMTRPLNTIVPVQESPEFSEAMSQITSISQVPNAMQALGKSLGISGLGASTVDSTNRDSSNEMDAAQKFKLAYKQAVQKREQRVRKVLSMLSLAEPIVSPDPDCEPGATSISDPVYRL